jgi:pyruvate dehydrogenase E2 component (dihydrolipoamide acetyltransferase)
MTEVIMPKMGDGMEEGMLLEWTKGDGDAVRPGEVIGTIQTDKATLELEAPGAGTLTGLLIQPGDTVPVGKPIALILRAGETVPPDWGKSREAVALPASGPAAAAVEAALKAPGPKPAGRPKASPLARKMAQEHGIGLASVQGTGPGGRITERDVAARIEMGASAMAATAPVAAPGPTGQDVLVPLSRLRQIVAQRTSQAKQEIPHFYVTVEVDLERIVALRQEFAADDAGKVSVNDFVIKACALALQEMPDVNASFTGDGLLRYGAVHIGVAVALDEGLVVAVVKNAHAKTLRQIAAEARDLTTKAREGRLMPDEMSGSTFSVSNMGMMDVDSFAAIINQPNAAILAVGSARKRVVVNEAEELEVRTMMKITGSFDHRAVDGATGARFVNLVKAHLQNPTRLLA